jgi:4-hydroxybenzoate polyprenyltransferase
MKTKLFVIPILVLVILTGIATPPVQAEFLTVSIILAAAFITAVAATEVIKSEPGTEPDHQVGIDHSEIIMGPQ